MRIVLSAYVVLFAVMHSKSVQVAVDFKLNQASLRISKFLTKLLADVTEIVLLTIVLGQGIIIISLVLLTVLASRMSILLVIIQVSPFEKLLLKWQNWFAFDT